MNRLDSLANEMQHHPDRVAKRYLQMERELNEKRVDQELADAMRAFFDLASEAGLV